MSEQQKQLRESIRERQSRGDMTVSNREVMDAYAIDPNIDPYSIPLDEMDPSHPSLYEADTFQPYFQRLRDEDPVHYTEDSMFGAYWSVTKYMDIMQVDTHHEIFSSQESLGGIALGGGEGQEQQDEQYRLPMFIAEDPPLHDQQRMVVAPMFTPKNLAELEPLIRQRAANILDNLPRNEEFNWVREVSVELTAQMLATLFDIPQEDRLKLIHWSDTVSNIGDPDYFDTPEQGFMELFACLAYFTEYYEARKNEPPAFNLLSMLAHDPSTNNMTPQELLGNVLLLIVGGNDTTRNSISAGVQRLNENPDQYQKLMQNPSLIPKMIPEIIRFHTPISHMARTAVEDTELGGKKIRKGDRVAMWYASGNRDETYLDKPNEFIIDRPNPRQHTAFGYGVHRCLGNRLAEMQLRTIWEEIMKRFSKVEVVGDTVYTPSSFIHGIRELPVMIRD